MPQASIFVPGYGWLALGGSTATIPGETGTVGPYRIAMHADLPDGFAVAAFTTGISPLGPRSVRHVDAGRYDRIRMLLHVGQAGAQGYIGIQYVDASNTAPAEGDWLWADGIAGPRLPVTTAGTVQISSPFTALALGARGDVQFRAVAIDGNNTPGLFIQSLDVELEGTPAGGGGVGEPPQPDPCVISSFQALLNGYANKAAMEADGWTWYEPDGALTWDLATHPSGGQKALKITVDKIPPSATATVAYRFKLYKLIGGYIPGASYFMNWDQYPTVETSPFVWFTPLNTRTPWYGTAHAGFNPVPNRIANSAGEVEVGIGFGILNIGGTPGAPFSPVNVAYLDNLTLSNEACLPAVAITPLPPAGPRRLLLWGYTPSTWGTYPPFNGALVNVTPSNVISVLNQARSAGMRVMLNLVLRSAAKANGGIFTQGAYLGVLNTFSAINLASFADVIIAMMVIDEPQLSTAGGWGTVVPLSVVDGVLSKRYYELWPTLRRMVRVSPTMWKQSGVTASYTTSLYPVFAGSRQQQGISAFMAAEKAVAATLAATAGHPVDIMWGVNVTGSGPSGGTITPASIHTDQVPMARDTTALGIGLWVPSDSGGPTAAVDFLKTTAYVAAFTEVAATLVP